MEIDRTMALLGCQAIDDIDSTLIHAVDSPPSNTGGADGEIPVRRNRSKSASGSPTALAGM
jgi:hypothetical protein